MTTSSSGRGTRRPARDGRHPLVLVVDDHVLFADAVRAALRHARFDVTEPVGTAAEAVVAARRLRPDVALVDVGLPDESGLEAGHRMLDVSPRTKIVVVTALQDPGVAEEVERAGFHGLVRKDAKIAHLVEAIQRVLNGEVVRVPSATKTNPDGPSRAAGTGPITPHLTRRELEVLALLARGVRGSEIARTLGVTPNTVRTHVQNVLTKLQVHSRLEAASVAARHGLLTSGLGSE